MTLWRLLAWCFALIAICNVLFLLTPGFQWLNVLAAAVATATAVYLWRAS